ncbi:MAG: Gfo/Idh/MocA family oxidoreductase [Verrucomicrobia bacterium]|nr:Gfo/Idh/MocA family oxidoreductase [Verrucomicrobiota bacterium]
MKKSPDPVRIGVLGCGMISQAAHFESCQKAKNARLYAICDAADDLRNRMAQIWEPEVAYSKYEEMLADPKVEGVIIGIADQFHVPTAAQAIKAGKHVLVEKPLGVNVEECVELLKIKQAAPNLIFRVGSMKRFDPGVAFARRFIDQEMGARLALKAWYCDSTSRYTETANVQPLVIQSAKAKRPEGNPKANRESYYLLGHGSHLVDTARFLGGEITRVNAKLVQKYGAYCWFVATDFADDSAGHLDLTLSVRMGWHEGFQIYGEFGSVIGKLFNPWYLKSAEVECFSLKDGQFKRVLGEDGHFYRLQVESFADAIRGEDKFPAAGLEDGLAAIRVLRAIQLSTEKGEPVGVADVTGAI